VNIHVTTPIVDNDWTDERVSILVQMREQGVQRGAIADAINKQTGSNFTRSAICGKIDRLFPAAKPVKTPEERAETLKAQRERDAEKKRAKRAAEREAAGRASKPQQVPIQPVLVVVETKPEDFPGARVHGVDALERHHCRFICNDDMSEPVYCGMPIMANSRFSYCAGHHRVCVAPPKMAGSIAA
jgi:hypothetical protein